MKRLGMYTTTDGRRYDVHYYAEDEIAKAIGPLPERVGATGVAGEFLAKSEEEARKKVAEALGPGTY